MKRHAKGNRFTLEFYGDWESFSRGARYVESDEFMDDLLDDLERLGHQITHSLRSHIISQDLNWPALSPLTVHLKGGRREILLDTMSYASSFEVGVKQRWKRYAELTVWPDGTMADRRISYQQLAYWHEYGTRYMPERPLWRPVAGEIDSMEAFQSLQKMNKLMVKMVAAK